MASHGSAEKAVVPAATMTLLQAALGIFIVTVVIGFLNAFVGVNNLSDAVALTHLHSGALGWITLGALGAAVWLFSADERATSPPGRSLELLTAGLIVAVTFYVLAFLSGQPTAMVIGGTLTALALLAFYAWVLAQGLRVGWTVPRLGVALALTTLAIGALVGVAIDAQLAGVLPNLPQGAFAAHPVTMLGGYLILMAMALTEWRLGSGRRGAWYGRLGVAQMVVPFLGSLLLTVGAVLNQNALVLLSTPLVVLAILVYLGRLAGGLRGVAWRTATGQRFYGLAALFLGVYVVLFVVLISFYVSAGEEGIPQGVFHASDHAVFIGVMTNVLLGLVSDASSERRSLWPWADDVVFWGMNVGLAGFLVILLAGAFNLDPIPASVMGVSILLGIVTYSLRLQEAKAGRVQELVASVE